MRLIFNKGHIYIYYPECPVLPSWISHGFVNGSGSLEGNQYEFSCQEGYSLIGAATSVCTDSGVWNSSLPTCLIGMSSVYDQRSILPLDRERLQDINYLR